MSPPFRMPPSAMTFTYSPVSSMFWERAAATSAIAVACGTPMPSTPRVVHAAPGPTPDEHGLRPRAHEVQAGGVGGTAPHHDRNRHLADELLEVERGPRLVLGDVLGGDHGALDHEDVEARLERRLVVGANALRREGGGAHHALVLDLADPLHHQVLVHRGGVDLLHLGGGRVGVEARDALELLLGVLVAGVHALEVEHGQAAELADGARRARRDHPVHRRGQQRELELVEPELPGDVHLIGVARAARGHDGDVVEAVGATALLAPTDLYFHGGILGSRADERSP